MISICVGCKRPTRECNRVFLSCGCHFCFRCFIKKQATNTEMDLDCCGQRVKSFDWEMEKKVLDKEDDSDGTEEVGETAAEELLETVEVTHSRKKCKWQFDPFRIYVNTLFRDGNEAAKLRIGTGLLYTSVHLICWDNDRNIPRFEMTDYTLSANGDYFPTQNDLTRLQTATTYLHAAIYPLSRTDSILEKNGAELQEEDEDIEVESSSVEPECHTLDRLITNHIESKQLLAKIVYSLATGKIAYRITQENDDKNPAKSADVTSGNVDAAMISQVGACALATDLMMRAGNVRQVGNAIGFFSFQLEHASLSQLQIICSKLRLSHSRYHLIVKKARSFVDKLVGNGKFGCDPRDLPIEVPDNLQYQHRNKYFHCVPSTTQNTPEEELIKAGLYNDDDESKRLSRKPGVDWPNYAATTSAEAILQNVFRAKDSDYYSLGVILLVHFTLVLKYADRFPNINDCHDKFVRKDWRLQFPLPVVFRLSEVADLGMFPDPTNEPDVEDEPELEEDCPTMWEKNNIHPNPVVFANMANKVFLKAFAEAMMRTARNRSEDFKNDENNGGKEPPISDDFVFCLMDGSPNGYLRRLMDEDALVNATDAQAYAKLRPLIGLFHQYMELFKKTHQLTHEIISFIGNSFTGPNGDDNLDFFLDFPDPTKPEKQMSQIILAVLAYILRCMIKDGNEEASAANAHKFMLERAKECPAAKALLDLILLYEIVILSRRAISLNSYDLSVAVMRLSLPLLADTHATVYARLFCDLLKYDKTMSAMERRFIEKFGLTVETVNGERKARDWAEEKYNCAIKKQVPKYCSRGMHAKLESACMTVMDDEKRGGKRVDEAIREGGYRSSERIENWTYDGETFIKVSLALEPSKIFEKGRRLHVNGEEYSNNKYHSPANGEPIPAEVLRWLSIGERRVDHYATKFYVETLNSVYRSEEDMGLSPIMMRRTQAAQHIELATVLAFSLDSSELEKGTVPQLVKEIDRTCELWPDVRPQRPVGITARTEKKRVVNALIRLRTIAFRKENAEEIKAQLRHEIDLSCPFLTTVEDRTVELDHKFYHFVPGVCDKPEFIETFELNS